MDVACSRADSFVFIVVEVGGGCVGDGFGSGAPGYVRWQARTAPMMAKDGRTRIGYQIIGTPLLLAICRISTPFANVTDRG